MRFRSVMLIPEAAFTNLRGSLEQDDASVFEWTYERRARRGAVPERPRALLGTAVAKKDK